MSNTDQIVSELQNVLEIKPTLVALYVELVRCDPVSALSLARLTGIKRATLYEQLAELEKRGLVKMMRGKPSRYRASDPKELLIRYSSKLGSLKNLMPILNSFRIEGSEQIVFDMYEGAFGLRKLCDILLELKPKPKEILVISSVHSIERALGKKWLAEWVRRRVRKGIATRGLISEEGMGRATINAMTSTEELRQVHFLPQFLNPEAEINIIGDYISVFFPIKEYRAFIIKSSEFASTLKQVFEFLWGITKRV